MAKKPTGLTVSRKNNALTLSWKAPETYTAQQLRYRINGKNTDKKSTYVSIGKSTKSKAIKLTLSNFIPSKSKALQTIEFQVRGKKGGKWSAWTTKSYTVKIPDKPKVTAELSDTATNATKFSWEASTTDTGSKFFTRCEWEAVLLKNNNEANNAKAFAKGKKDRSGTSGATGSVTITESGQVATGSWTRIIRVRTSGPRGRSAWVYSKHVYAKAQQTKNVKWTIKNTASGYILTTSWTSQKTTQFPVDTITLRYAMATPAAGLTAPNSLSWEDGGTVFYKSGSDKLQFEIGEKLDVDQCLYVQVNTQHDSFVTYGNPQLVLTGKLAEPSINSVTTNPDTHKATISAKNNSSVPNSFLAIKYRTGNDAKSDIIVGVIPAGSSQAVVQCPNWGSNAVSFGVYAVAGTYKKQTRSDGVDIYTVTPYNGKPSMVSSEVWSGGSVPIAPKNVTLERTETEGTVRVVWSWDWKDATAAELSWSDHSDAWESTDEPSTYTVSNMYASHWNIAGLEAGVTWYVRVRLIMEGSDDNTTYGPWSEPVSISLASSPNVPALTLSSSIISNDGHVEASWGYVSTDSTPQVYAEISEAIVDNNGLHYGRYELTKDTTVKTGKTYYSYTDGIYTEAESPTGNPKNKGWFEIVEKIVGRSETAQRTTIYANEAGWTNGNTYNLAVRVVSGSGESSGWSDPIGLTIAEPMTCKIQSTSLENITLNDDDGETREVLSLTDMPLTASITGAGELGTTILTIERDGSYYIDRPDETKQQGYDGETIFSITQQGEDTITVALDDDNMLGTLDDGAKYVLTATTLNDLGQKDSTELPFEVHWKNQAIKPVEASVVITDGVAILTPIAPEGTRSTDYCDIYRLSADRPVLVYPGASFGIPYVDPYPAIGEFGGHRFVFRTANGDYITEDNELAWLDTGKDEGDRFDTMFNIIEFDGNTVNLFYEIQLSNSWKKDLETTQYLDGSIVGDWGAGVERTGSISATTVTVEDQETIKDLRRLADYTGYCHVRTRDGSSYVADVQVSESRNMGHEVEAAEFSISVTKIDPETYDGMTYAEYMEG